MLCPIFLFDTQKISSTYFDKEFCYQSIDRTLNSLIRIRCGRNDDQMENV